MSTNGKLPKVGEIIFVEHNRKLEPMRVKKSGRKYVEASNLRGYSISFYRPSDEHPYLLQKGFSDTRAFSAEEKVFNEQKEAFRKAIAPLQELYSLGSMSREKFHALLDTLQDALTAARK